jgi:DNA-binding GntR family transcriptional regulator
MSSLPQVTRLKDENMRAFAYRVLFACIREIILPPGYAMSEAKMAKELMISRTPVHDTFARLYREGLLEIAPQSGTFVRCLDPESIKELRWINLTMDKSVFGQLYSLRPSREQLKPLDICCDETFTAIREHRYQAVSGFAFRFRSEMYHLAGYDTAYSMIDRISSDLYRLLRLVTDEKILNSIAALQTEVFEALLLHDHEAACRAADRCFEQVDPALESVKASCPGYFIGGSARSLPASTGKEAEGRIGRLS